MDVSRVTFFAQTKAALDNPGLSPEKKRALKIERVKTYIRSKPVGTKFKLSDLIAAAGYRIADKKSYQAGYAFVKALDGKEITIEQTPKFRKSVVVLKDESVRTVVPAKPKADEAQGDAAEDKQTEKSTNPFRPFLGVAVDVDFIRQVEVLAREFSWKNDSNDLREFIRSLK